MESVFFVLPVINGIVTKRLGQRIIANRPSLTHTGLSGRLGVSLGILALFGLCLGLGVRAAGGGNIFGGIL